MAASSTSYGSGALPTGEASWRSWCHPMVMVLSSPEVDRICHKNHVTFTELLKPWGTNVDTSSVVFRSPTRSYQLRNFGVRFMAMAEFEPLEQKAADRYLERVLKHASPDKSRANDNIREAADVPSFVKWTPEPTPWMARYRIEFNETLRFNEAELLDHPCACIIAISTSDVNPAALAQDMSLLKNLPKLFRRGYYDSNIYRQYVLVHDMQNTDADALPRAMRLLADLRRVLGDKNNSVRMLQINSLPVDAPDQRQPDIWATHLSRTRALYSPQAQLAAAARADGREPPPMSSASMGYAPSTTASSTTPLAAMNATAAMMRPTGSPPPPPQRTRPADGPQQATMGSPGSPINQPVYSGPTASSTVGGIVQGSGTIPTTPTAASAPTIAATPRMDVDMSSDVGSGLSATPARDDDDDKDDTSTGVTNALVTSGSAATMVHPLSPAVPSTAPTNATITPSSAAAVVSPLAAAAAPVGPAVLNGIGSGTGRKGQYLSTNDMTTIGAFVTEFTLTALLPAIEQKLASLYEKIVARKTMGSRLGRMLGRRESRMKTSLGASDIKVQTYDLSTPESQMRQLSDLAFVMQDYDLALSQLKHVSSEYKQDKAWRHYASSQELMGICTILSSGSPKDANACFDAAMATYHAAGDSRRGTRAALWAYDMHRWAQRFTDAATFLLRASEKEPAALANPPPPPQPTTPRGSPLAAPIIAPADKRPDASVRGALLLEQAAYAFLWMKPPLVRKYAFHLVMAAHWYHKCNQKTHAVRCYASGRGVYQLRGWFHVEDHVNYNLGRDCFTLGDYQQAVNYFVSLIGKGRGQEGIGTGKQKQPAERQSTFLKDFALVVKKWSGGALKEVPQLKLPTFVDATVQIVINEPYTVPSAYADGVWNEVMRTNPAMALDATVCNKPIYSQNDDWFKEKDRGAVVHERIVVRLTVANPLQVDINVKKIRLRCRHMPVEEKQPENTNDTSSSTPKEEKQPPNEDDILVLTTVDLNLAANQSRDVELSVTCKREGTLCIDGITWIVADIICGFHPFDLPMPPMVIKSVGGRGRKKPQGPPNAVLAIPINPPAPLLYPVLDTVPTLAYHGEVRRMVLKLTNRGPVPLANVIVRATHPAFVTFVNPHLSPSPPSPLNGPTGTTSSLPPVPHHDRSYDWDWQSGLVHLGVTLEPGESQEIIVWLRAALVGVHNLGFLFHYVPATSGLTPTAAAGAAGAAGGKDPITSRFRLAYLSHTLRVTPLFTVRWLTRPSFGDVKETILGLEVEDRQTESRIPSVIQLSEVSVFSKTWQISPLESGAAAISRQIEGKDEKSTTNTNAMNNGGFMSGDDSDPFAAADPSSIVAHLPLAHPSLALSSCTLGPGEASTIFFRVTNLADDRDDTSTTSTSAASTAPPTPSMGAAVAAPGGFGDLTLGASLASASSRGAPSVDPLHHSAVSFRTTGDSAIYPATAPPLLKLIRMEKDLMIHHEKSTLIVNPGAIVDNVGAADRMDFVLAWSADHGTRWGFHHVPGQACMKTLPSACSLKVMLDYSLVVHHDFNTANLVDVPITMRIRNCLEDAPVTFTFETLPPEEEFDAHTRSFKQSASTSLHGRYLWRGTTRSRITDLQANGIVTLPLTVTFWGGGQYNLNRFRFTVEMPGNKPRVFFFPLQHLITIIHTPTPGVSPPNPAVTAARPASSSIGGATTPAAVRSVRTGSSATNGAVPPTASPRATAPVASLPAVDTSVISSPIVATPVTLTPTVTPVIAAPVTSTPTVVIPSVVPPTVQQPVSPVAQQPSPIAAANTSESESFASSSSSQSASPMGGHVALPIAPPVSPPNMLMASSPVAAAAPKVPSSPSSVPLTFSASVSTLSLSSIVAEAEARQQSSSSHIINQSSPVADGDGGAVAASSSLSSLLPVVEEPNNNNNNNENGMSHSIPSSSSIDAMVTPSSPIVRPASPIAETVITAPQPPAPSNDSPNSNDGNGNSMADEPISSSPMAPSAATAMASSVAVSSFQPFPSTEVADVAIEAMPIITESIIHASSVMPLPLAAASIDEAATSVTPPIDDNSSPFPPLSE